jgi:predicted PurR-regulated permease PerM
VSDETQRAILELWVEMVRTSPQLTIFMTFIAVIAVAACVFTYFAWRMSQSANKTTSNSTELVKKVSAIQSKLDEHQGHNNARHEQAESEIEKAKIKLTDHAVRITTLETDFSKIAKRTDDNEKIDNAN